MLRCERPGLRGAAGVADMGTADSNGVHDVSEEVGERTRLIPWVAAVVKAVDLPKRRVQVEWGADW